MLEKEVIAVLDFRMETFLTVCRTMNFTRAADWEAYDWKAKYPQLELTFHVKLVPLDDNINAGLE